MANIIISPRSSIDTTSAQFAQQHAGKLLGEDVLAGQPLELRADGLVYRWVGTTGAQFFGISPRKAAKGQPITCYGLSIQFLAAEGTLITGKTYFLSDAAGQIGDAAGTKDTTGSFFAVSTRDLICTRSFGSKVA